MSAEQSRTQTFFFWGGGLEIKNGLHTLGVRGADPPDAGEILKFYTKFSRQNLIF